MEVKGAMIEGGSGEMTRLTISEQREAGRRFELYRRDRKSGGSNMESSFASDYLFDKERM
jgi:hypothetical protein